MRKLYVPLLLVFSCFLSSHVPAGDSMFPNGGIVLADGKLTHFYPNPATSYINFSFDKSIDKRYSLQIYNFIGRKMVDNKVTDSKMTITLDDNFLRGLYIYQLRDATGKIVESGKFQVSK